MMSSWHIRIKYIKFCTSLDDKTYYKKSIKLNIFFVDLSKHRPKIVATSLSAYKLVQRF
jgi:hypothetical protein